MSFSSGAKAGNVAAAPVADFSIRADPAAWPELMDEPCLYDDLRGCLLDLEQINRLTLGYRPTLRFLDRIRAKQKTAEPLHILDVGAGGGDTLRRVGQWARERGVEVRLTGVDLNAHATRAAIEFTENDSSPEAKRVRWVTANIFEFVPDHPIDVVISSLMTHHLRDQEIIRFLCWMEENARRGWFVNDLQRSRRAAMGFSLLARVLCFHRFVRHDGPVSFQRAFSQTDWRALLASAGLASEAIELQSWQPARLCVARLRGDVAPDPKPLNVAGVEV